MRRPGSGEAGRELGDDPGQRSQLARVDGARCNAGRPAPRGAAPEAGGVRIETALARHARYSAATTVIPAPAETKSGMREPAGPPTRARRVGVSELAQREATRAAVTPSRLARLPANPGTDAVAISRST